MMLVALGEELVGGGRQQVGEVGADVIKGGDTIKKHTRTSVDSHAD